MLFSRRNSSAIAAIRTSLVADVPHPSADRAGIRRVCAEKARFVAGPVRPQELPEYPVVFAVIQARYLQITIRRRLDALALLPVFLGGYLDFEVRVLVALVEPENLARASVEPAP